MRYSQMLVFSPCENVRECPKLADTIFIHVSNTTHVWTCERDSGSPWSESRLCNVLEAQHALCCHWTSTEWNLKGITAGMSVCGIAQSSTSFSDVGLGLAFFELGDTLLSTPVSFPCLLGTWGISSSTSFSDMGWSLAFFVPGDTLLSIPVSFLFLLGTWGISYRGKSGLWVILRRLPLPGSSH